MEMNPFLLPEDRKSLQEYLKSFYKAYAVEKSSSIGLEDWCKKNLGKEYKDWFLYKGKNFDKFFTLYIKNQKLCLIFEIKWSQSIQGVDKP